MWRCSSLNTAYNKNVLFKLNRTFSITDIYAMPPVKRISMVAT